jgi:hypothetical protein
MFGRKILKYFRKKIRIFVLSLGKAFLVLLDWPACQSNVIAKCNERNCINAFRAIKTERN